MKTKISTQRAYIKMRIIAPEKTDHMKKQWLKAVLPFLVSLTLPLLGSSFIVTAILQHHNTISTFNLGQWTVFFLLTSLLMGFMLTPTTFIAMLSGYLLGLNAIIPVVAMYSIAAIIGYYTGKLLDKGKIETLLKHFNKEHIIQNIHTNDKWFVFTCRLSPVLPFAFTNVVLASINTPFKRFILWGTLGMLPRTLLAIWVGKQATSIYHLKNNSFEWNTESILLLSILLISFVLLSFVMKRILSGKKQALN